MSTVDDFPKADPMAQLMAQFAGQAQDNPGMAMLMQYLEQRQAAAAAAPVAQVPPAQDVSELEAIGPPRLDDATRADMRTLLAHSRAQEEELATLRARNDTLAAALGACHLCLGDDAWCPHCGGRGRPGAQRPSPGPFARYVRPLLNRLRPVAPAASAGPPAPKPSAAPRAAGAPFHPMPAGSGDSPR